MRSASRLASRRRPLRYAPGSTWPPRSHPTTSSARTPRRPRTSASRCSCSSRCRVPRRARARCAGGPRAPTPIGEGHSNVTFVLSAGVVLRRPPRGPLPPSAHDVLREARLLRALEATPVRVPRVLAVCEDPEVIGAPFYVMERVDGEVITDAIPPALDNARAARADRRRADRRAGRAARGRLDGARAGGVRQADRLPRAPAAPLQRAVGAQPDARAARGRGGRRLAGGQPARVPAGDDRPRRLPARQHDVRRTSAPARLVAIFDWEMATIGDPLADVGYLLMHWTQAGDAPSEVQRCTASPRSPASRPARELIARYEERSGRSMQRARLVRRRWRCGRRSCSWRATTSARSPGSTDDPYLKSFGEGVLELAERALDGHARWLLSSTAATAGCWSTGAAC